MTLVGWNSWPGIKMSTKFLQLLFCTGHGLLAHGLFSLTFAVVKCPKRVSERSQLL